MTKDNSTGKPKDFYSRGQQMFDSLNLPDEDDDDTQVYAKPWVGLTAEDLAQINTDEFWQVGNHMAIAMAVEDKLKEKNT